MTPLLVALALTLPAPPPASLPAPPHVMTLHESFEGLSPACADIDPSFVIDVAPPRGSGPLWAVGPSTAPLDARSRLKAKALPSRPSDSCPRLLDARGR